MIRLFSDVSERIVALPKARRFMVFLILAALVGTMISVLTWLALYRTPSAPAVTVAIIAPLSGPDAATGEALRDGAILLGKQRASTPQRRPITFKVVDSTQPNALKSATDDPNVVAVIGPNTPNAADAALLAQKSIAQIALSGEAATKEVKDIWSYPLSADAAFEARFLANYERNVVGEKLVSIILPEGEEWAKVANAFDETLQRFGTRVVFRWTIPAQGMARRTALEATGREISDKLIAGTMLVLGSPDFAAQAVSTLSASKITNRIIGLRDFGSAAFRSALEANWSGEGSLASAKNAILFTTPILFDVAGVGAQTFQNAYVSTYRRAPDWTAALGFDAAGIIGAAMDRADSASKTPSEIRTSIRQELNKLSGGEASYAGLAGSIFFAQKSGSALPTLVGRYDGKNIVAAETQLTPIREEGVTNFIQQITGGKVLYVNDRFMYRTNVVSAGIRLHKVGEPNIDANTVELDFMLWFRWRGNFAASEILFDNAVEPIVLGKPERTFVDGDEHYGAWRVRGRFFMNVSPIARPFGSQMITINMRHRTLAQNNLMYVADIVGMDLASTQQAGAVSSNWLARLLGVVSDERSALLRQLQDTKAMAGAPNYTVENALVAQEISRAGTDGDPSFVGFGKPAPMFSRLAMHVQVKRDGIDLRGLLPQTVMVYLAIFALCGSILAYILDRKDRGQFWRMQTMVLRLVSWPVLLAALSALTLDYMAANAAISVVEIVDFASKCLWWLVPARLTSLFVERFIWSPLEARTGRRIPTVFRMIVTLLIFTLAAFGIVSFVLNKPVTNLLATSGLITLIFGLALQSNLKDVFSGVMLNLERPFVLNDWVRINKTIAQVYDISWRTTRLRTAGGQIIALANGKVVDAEIENLTKAGLYNADMEIYMDPRSDPKAVISAIEHALFPLMPEIGGKVFRVSLSRIENINGEWAARYLAEVRIPDLGVRGGVYAKLWPAIWQEFAASNLNWASKRPAQGEFDVEVPHSAIA